MIPRDKTLKLLAIAAVPVVIADLLVERHEHFPWDQIPAWPALYGLVSCIAIIWVSKWLGRGVGLMKPPDYYERNRPTDNSPDDSPQESPEATDD